MQNISVILVDDHAVVRSGVRAFLASQPGIDIVGEAATGEEAIALAESTRPTVALVDLMMPGMSGADTIRLLRKTSPSTRIIAFTSFAEDSLIFPAIKAGAQGYLLKDVKPSELADAIRIVCRGEPALHSSIARRLMVAMAKDEQSGNQPLTPRENEVLELLGEGLSNKEIADKLVLSEKTVKTHVSNILGKLRLSDRVHAALYAVKRTGTPERGQAID